MSWYTEIACTNVNQFIGVLDSTLDMYGSKKMIYRGQADSDWELRPTLYRHRYGNIDFEIDIVDSFMLASHKSGRVIPSDAMSYISRVNENTGRPVTRFRIWGGKFEYDVGNIAFAMARHAEIPTRHLDFTWDPLVAAYFTIETLAFASEKQPPERLAVWAIEYRKLFHTFGLIHHDWADIPSLRNQKGLFVYDPTIDISSLKCWTEAPSFDAVLSQIGDVNMTKKITLPCTNE
ncbi:MAG: FRG domain-containing protein, partial [Candidatus Poribacteria bacterium]|nr:FRG domain-containing protein [Candidatus Poribacteria bacterium]